MLLHYLGKSEIQKGEFWCILGAIFALELNGNWLGHYLPVECIDNAFLLCCINITANEYGAV